MAANETEVPLVKMKTQNFGSVSDANKFAPYTGPDVPPKQRCWTNRIDVLRLRTLENYRQSRENGSEEDNPKRPFPSYGLENITTYTDLSRNFDCNGDPQRGWPEVFVAPNRQNAERHWIFIKHKQSGTVISGFSEEPNFNKGSGWRLYKFSDEHCPAIREWMEEKDFNYLKRIRVEDPSLFKRVFAELKAANPKHPAISKLELEINKQMQQDVKLSVEQAFPPVSIVKMKTQLFGRNHYSHKYALWQAPYGHPVHSTSLCDALAGAVKDYRDQRENGDRRDDPKEAFPTAGFDALKIKSSTYKPDRPKGENYWPDKQGRYWWKLNLEDGRVTEDYYWKKDEIRGYPDKADEDRYWFSVNHAPSNTKIEGFSARPDREKGYPDKSGSYWSYIQYDECGPIKQWMEQKDRNYVARLQREKEQEQSNAAALRAAEEKQRQEQLEVERLRLAEIKELEDRKLREESEKRAAELQRLEEARVSAEKAQALVAAEKKALEEERLRAEQEKRQLEEQRRKLEEEQAKKLSVSASSSSPMLSAKSELSLDSSFTVRYEEIQIIQELGAGAFGVVSYGKWRFEDVAVKTLHLQRLSENALVEFKEEAAIMSRLRSDYIVLLKGVSLQPYALIMEYMPNGSLFGLLHSSRELPMSIRHRIALDVAKGLAFLHQHAPHGILHRDLKSQNVLLTQYLHAKLADFGLSKVRVESSRSQTNTASGAKSVGTIPWMAPECFGIRPKYSEKSDMYAYGMVLWELISRRMPYEDVTDANEIREAVKNGEREEIPEQSTNPREEVPVSFKKVIRFCWFQEVEKRPTAKDAIEMLGDIAIPMPSPSFGSGSSSSGGLPSGFISNFSSFKH